MIKHLKNKKLVVLLLVFAVIIVLTIIFSNTFSQKVKTSDKVSIEYAAYFENGTLIDTNIKEIRDKNMLDKGNYEPLEFVVGSGQLIKGVESGIIGMSNGSSQVFTLKPEEAYGLYDEKLIFKDINKRIQIKKNSVLSLQTFKSVFSKEPIVGDIIKDSSYPWDLMVESFDNSSVVIKNVVNIGNSVKLPGVSWGAHVEGFNNESIVVYQDLNLSDVVQFAVEGGPRMGVISFINDTTFDIDTNHPLAGKTLLFEIKVLDIKN